MFVYTQVKYLYKLVFTLTGILRYYLYKNKHKCCIALCGVGELRARRVGVPMSCRPIGRKLIERLGKHEAAWRKQKTGHSSSAEHLIETEQEFNSECIELLH
jgi:hypothetical protein